MVNTTKPTSINKIYNELKSFGIAIGKNALYEWIDHLGSIYLFFALTKYDPSIVKENAAEKKYYCIDNGLQMALSTSLSRNMGALLENFLFLWLRRDLTMNAKLFYYKGKKECDFVVTEADRVGSLIQSAWELSDNETLNREIDGLLEASESLKCNNLWLITQEMEENLIRSGKTIKIRPAWWVCRQPAKEME